MQKGFIMFELLIGFVIFSLLMMIYLPGLYQILVTMKIARQENQYHEICYELVRIATNHPDNEVIDREYYDEVESFECQETQCQIHFKDGYWFEIKQETLEME